MAFVVLTGIVYFLLRFFYCSEAEDDYTRIFINSKKHLLLYYSNRKRWLNSFSIVYALFIFIKKFLPGFMDSAWWWCYDIWTRVAWSVSLWVANYYCIAPAFLIGIDPLGLSNWFNIGSPFNPSFLVHCLTMLFSSKLMTFVLLSVLPSYPLLKLLLSRSLAF